MSIRRVLVVGGGIGGLTAAIAFRRRGIEVDLIELHTRLQVRGAGILQQGNVVRALAGLDVAQEYLSAGFGFDDLQIWDTRGESRARVRAQRLTGLDCPAMLGISRRVLHQVLLNAATKLDTQIRTGLTVDTYEESAEAVTACLTDGTEGRYDLLIGADGRYSKVRALTFGSQWQPAFTGQSVWRHNFRRHPKIDCLVEMGGAGYCPLSEHLMYLYVTSAEPGNPYMPEAKLPALMRERLAGYGGLTAELSAQITDPAEVTYRPIEALLMPAPWHRGRAVLIGDAAHVMTPHLGQGAGMAIEDAVVLAEEFGGDQSADQALANYMARRWERCKLIFDASIDLCRDQVAGRTDIDFAALTQRIWALTAQAI